MDRYVNHKNTAATKEKNVYTKKQNRKTELVSMPNVRKATRSAAQATTAADSRALQVRVVGQYLKHLSFENPNIRKLIDGPGEKPKLRVEVDVNATRMNEKIFESAIDFKAKATTKAGVVYDLELSYAGLFEIQNIPEQVLETVLLINFPSLLFPFLRRLVADLTREGGFPPLLLDPIDFARLFIQKQQEGAANTAGPITTDAAKSPFHGSG